MNYPYSVLSDNSGHLISGELHISGHTLVCSMNKVNIFSSICSGELLAAVEAASLADDIDEISVFMNLPRATGARSSRHNENWIQTLCYIVFPFVSRSVSTKSPNNVHVDVNIGTYTHKYKRRYGRYTTQEPQIFFLHAGSTSSC